MPVDIYATRRSRAGEIITWDVAFDDLLKAPHADQQEDALVEDEITITVEQAPATVFLEQNLDGVQYVTFTVCRKGHTDSFTYDISGYKSVILLGIPQAVSAASEFVALDSLYVDDTHVHFRAGSDVVGDYYITIEAPTERGNHWKRTVKHEVR